MKIQLFLILLPLIFSVGCGSSRITPTGKYQSNEIVTSITKATPTNLIVIDTSFPTSTAPSVEHTKQPTLPSETLVLTVVPTYSPEESLELVSEFLSNNGNCRLPCIWGLTPSKTEVQSFSTFADKFGEIDKDDVLIFSRFYDSVGGIAFFWWVGNVRNIVDFGYWEINNIVDVISLLIDVNYQQGEGSTVRFIPAYGDPSNRQLQGYYRLDKILTNYGIPSQVLIHPYPKYPSDPVDYQAIFSLVLDYSDKGFFIEYLMPRRDSNGFYSACPIENAYLNLVSWNPQKNLKIDEAAKYSSGPGLNELGVSYYLPIDQAEKMSIEEFHKEFSNHESEECIEVSKNYWPYLDMP